jgi:uncharacterized protein
MNKFFGIIAVGVLVVLFAIVLSTAPDVSDRSNNIVLPAPTGYVVDTNNSLSEETEAALTKRITDNKDKAEIAVLTLDSTYPLSIEEYGIKLAEYWKVGDDVKDDGIIVILATKDRKVRVEVGLGMEGVINDSKAGNIVDTYMLPFLKVSNWNEGMINGVEGIIKALYE